MQLWLQKSLSTVGIFDWLLDWSLSLPVPGHPFPVLHSLWSPAVVWTTAAKDYLSFKKVETHHLNLFYFSSYPQNRRHSVIKRGEGTSILSIFKSRQEGIWKAEVWTTWSQGKELSLSTDLFINTALQKTTDNCNGANSSLSTGITPSGLSGTAQGISSMKEN